MTSHETTMMSIASTPARAFIGQSTNHRHSSTCLSFTTFSLNLNLRKPIVSHGWMQGHCRSPPAYFLLHQPRKSIQPPGNASLCPSRWFPLVPGIQRKFRPSIPLGMLSVCWCTENRLQYYKRTGTPGSSVSYKKGLSDPSN